MIQLLLKLIIIVLLFSENNVIKSTNNACNAMIHNPIYDGPVYESVHRQFEALTLSTPQAADNCDEQPYNSEASTPTSSEKSVRYVDQPFQRPDNVRSKSFISKSPLISSDQGTTAQRSTSVSIPCVPKKTGKERNKLHLTLTLTGIDLDATNEPHPQSQIQANKATNAAAAQLTDVDDNYLLMSPIGVLSGIGNIEWSEPSPEDSTQKYKE